MTTNQGEALKKPYERPMLQNLGSVSELTLGNNVPPQADGVLQLGSQ